MIRFTGDGEFVPASMRPFQKKPTVILATQVEEEFEVNYEFGVVEAIIGRPGDWLIQDHTGRLSVVGKEIFAKFYEEAV